MMHANQTIEHERRLGFKISQKILSSQAKQPAPVPVKTGPRSTSYFIALVRIGMVSHS